MRLDSVRELKASLSGPGLGGLAGPVAMRSMLSGAAREVGRPAPTLALGIASRTENDFLLAVRIQHRLLEISAPVERIVERARGEVDVRYIGSVVKRAVPWHQHRRRPLLIGCSVGHFRVTAGTLGAFVCPRDGGSVRILSNNHVLANENRAKKGDPILQPGVHDGGADPDDRVAVLDDFVRFKRSSGNRVDCAAAELVEGIETNLAHLRGLGKLKGVVNVFADLGAEVSKIGRTTGLTRGRITAFELDNLVVGFDTGAYRFDNQIEIEGAGDGPFSLGGDSGSLIVRADRRAVALLFAGSDQGGANAQGLTYANPIRAVLDALDVELCL